MNRREFIEKAIKIHGMKYCYDNVKYITRLIKVSIKCSEHGFFNQTPAGHLNKRGCKKCGHLNKIKKLTCARENFINKANIKYNNKYDYSEVNYTNTGTQVNIKWRKQVKNKIVLTA